MVVALGVAVIFGEELLVNVVDDAALALVALEAAAP